MQEKDTKERKLTRYKKLEEKKPTIIFSCNPVNYNLLIEYSQVWNSSRSLFVDALIDFAISEYKQNKDSVMKHLDHVINAKKHADIEKSQHL